VRSGRPTLPVIILTARGEESDRVKGLQLGADDYVVKPFSIKELLARVEAVLRRSPERPTDVEELPVPGGLADFHRREVRFEDGTREALSEREADLLRYLAQSRERVVSRQELLRRLWGLSTRGVETRAIDMHIARLREKLRDDPDAPKVILTVRGKGYMLGETPKSRNAETPKPGEGEPNHE
jgi:DNA-binding response OmpR family regulator